MNNKTKRRIVHFVEGCVILVGAILLVIAVVILWVPRRLWMWWKGRTGRAE